MKIFWLGISTFLLLTNTTHATLLISELLPNPDGTDTGQEWVEIFNNSTKNADLNGYILDTGKKNQALSSLQIGPREFALIDNLKITLRNSDGYLALLSPDGQIIDKINYDKAPSGQSLSLITIHKDSQRKQFFNWSSPTPAAPNPEFREVEGKISSVPVISTNFTFQITDNNGQARTIIFGEEDFEFKLVASSFLSDTTVRLLIETKENQNIMRAYEIVAPPPTTNNTKTTNHQNWYYPTIIAILGLLLALHRLRK